jgi:hypothetical protein
MYKNPSLALQDFLKFPRDGSPPAYFPSTEAALWQPQLTAYEAAKGYYEEQHGLPPAKASALAIDDAGRYVRRDPRKKARDVWSLPETVALRRLAAEGRVGDAVDFPHVRHPSSLNLQRRALRDAFGHVFDVKSRGHNMGFSAILIRRGDDTRTVALKPRRKPRPARLNVSPEVQAEYEILDAAIKAGISDLL